MAKVVGLNGKPISPHCLSRPPLSVLKDLVASIEAGEVDPECLLIIAECRVKDAPGKVTHPTWDSGLMAADAIFLLETVKADILEFLRNP